MPKLIAHAVVREDPPRVAEDEATLNWILALRVVAQTGPNDTIFGRLTSVPHKVGNPL